MYNEVLSIGGIMRFLFNFIFFGILFYLIYLFFPEAFKTLVSWVEHIYLFLKSLTLDLIARFNGMKEGGHVVQAGDIPEKALLLPFIWLLLKR